MYKIILTLCFILLLVCGSTAQAKTGNEKSEGITGAVVAYHHWLALLPCYHICGGAILVRIDNPNQTQPRYIYIDFSYPDRRFPKELVASKKLWRFKVTRINNAEKTIEKYVKSVDEKTGKEIEANVQVWKLVTGAEDEELPFGQVIPSYSLNEDIQELIRRNKR